MSKSDDLVQNNLALVHACAKRFVGKGIEYDDLVQAGNVGLVKAAKGFDEQRGLQFSTYAVPTILGEMKRLFRDGGTVKVSRSLKELQLRVNRVLEQYRKQGAEPTVTQLAEELGVSAEEICESMCAARPVLSLTVYSEDGEEQMDLPTDDAEDLICERISIEQALRHLEERDQRIIRLRYFSEKTQMQTAAAMGMTQVQISRREKTILLKLREILGQEKCKKVVKNG